MDNTESMKPQQTGGLKLMTVFIAVLALHVLVIGGFTVYHLMGSGGADADLTLDKTHKLKVDGTPVADTTTPDATASDKSADATGTATAADATSVATTTGTSTTPTTEATGTTTAATASTPATTATQVAASPSTTTQSVENVPATPAKPPGNSPIVISGDDMSQTSTIPEALVPPPDVASAPGVRAVASVPAPSAVSMPPSVMPPAPVVDHQSAPAREDAIVSAAAPSGPVNPAVAAPSGPVHMPATPPQLAPTTAVDAGESAQHAPAATHTEHALASTHEAKKQYYTVKITDSYQKIARTHHITVAELKAANHIKGDKLHTGARLIIPESKTEVARSERSHDSSTDATASTTSLSASPVPHQHHFYTVTKGDTLAYIAHKFDVTVPELKDANDVTSTKQLRVGEKLRIPSRESRTADTASFRPTPAPAPIPAPVQPSQVETQPAPVVQPEPTPVATPEPVPQPSPTPASSPELANLTF